MNKENGENGENGEDFDSQQEETAAANALRKMVADEQARQKAEEEAKKPARLEIGGTERFATKEDLAAEIANIKKENQDMKALFLKAKAQGKANIREELKESNADLRNLYKGIFDFK